MPTFIAINMNDFHRNQKPGVPGTTCEMLFYGAADKDSAARLVMKERPGEAWSIIPKSSIDRRIVLGDRGMANET